MAKGTRRIRRAKHEVHYKEDREGVLDREDFCGEDDNTESQTRSEQFGFRTVLYRPYVHYGLHGGQRVA